MRQRMALEVDDAALLHLVDLCPRHVVRIGANEVGNQENRALEAVFLKDRISVLVIVDIAVIKGQDDGLIGQRRAIFKGIHHLCRRDGMIAVIDEVFHLLLEFIRMDRQRIFIAVIDLMIVEYRHSPVGSMHAICADGKYRRENNQKEQQDSFDPGNHQDTSFSYSAVSIRFPAAWGQSPMYTYSLVYNKAKSWSRQSRRKGGGKKRFYKSLNRLIMI